ncbi:MAG: glycosyltransferase [Microthrixaceae bacterium]|nr:glycosyltransferase [Microthrixaceae bacterium]
MTPAEVGTYGAIVVTFRRPASLGAVLDSVAAQTRAPEKVVVADNDPRRSAEEVCSRHNDTGGLPVVYLPIGDNTGPAGGWAAAAEFLVRDEVVPEWILVVDDDDPLGHPDLVERLLEVVECRKDGHRCAAVGLRGANINRVRGRLQRVRGTSGEPVSADYLASGGAPLYRIESIRQVGFFNSQLFFGFEDLDMGLRLQAAGWKLWAVSLPEMHVPAESAPTGAPWREYFKSRALVYITRRRLGKWVLAVVLLRSVLVGSIVSAVRWRSSHSGTARISGALDGYRGKLGPAGRAPHQNESKELA